MAEVGPVVPLVQSWLSASDPGLVRLTMAARGTLAVFLTTMAAILAGRLAHVPAVEFASGVALGLMGPFLMREPTLRQRQQTLVLLMVPAAIATIATAFLQGRGPAGDACFLALVFVCFLFHPKSQTNVGLGFVAVVVTYIGLILELPPSTLPMQLSSIVVAAPIVAFACFVAVPMNPAATLRRTIEAVQWRAAEVLRSARIGNGSSVRLWQRDLARLNEAALAADDQLALLLPSGHPAIRTGLVDLELATARLIERVGQEKPGPRHAMRLRLHERRMRRGKPYSMPRDFVEPGNFRASLVELGHAVHALGIAASAMGPASEGVVPPGLPPGPLAWRLATRVTLAAGLAMAAGMALSPQRWFWAVMTVYVVFLNARSRGDTVYRGFQRLGGTLLGIAGGLVLAWLLAGHESLQVAALLLSIFGMFYVFIASYTAGIFCVTVMLGLLYGILGAPLETILLLRLEETAIGAAAAMFVAMFVFPIRTRDQVIRSGRNVLEALVKAVAASKLELSGATDASPTAAMRQVDRQVGDLRLALAPLTAGRFKWRYSSLERPFPALFDCVHTARVLAAVSRSLPETPDGRELIARVGRVEARLASLAQMNQFTTEAVQADPLASEDILADATSGPVRAALSSLENAVATLAERLKIGELEGFALDA